MLTNGSHLGWRTRLSYTILKEDHPKRIYLTWLSGFKGENVKINFCQNQPIMYIFIQNPVTYRYVILLIKIKLLFIFQLIWWENAALLLALYVCYIFYILFIATAVIWWMIGRINRHIRWFRLDLFLHWFKLAKWYQVKIFEQAYHDERQLVAKIHMSLWIRSAKKLFELVVSDFL